MNVTAQVKKFEARNRALLTQVEADLTTLHARVAQHEVLRATLRRNLGLTGAAPAVGPRPGTGRRIAPGSVEGRVLEIVGEAKAPLALTAITAKTNAGEYQSRRAVNALVEAGRLAVVGNGRTRKYAPPPSVRVPRRATRGRGAQ